MEDKDIIDLFLARDEMAIHHTERKYAGRLKAISMKILRDFSDVSECVNDTYLKAWNHIPPTTPYDYFFSYLAKITRNLSLDRYKKQHAQKRNVELEVFSMELIGCIPSNDTAFDSLEEEAFSELMGGFLKQLKESERDVFLRRYWFFDGIKDIANRYSISESKTKSMLFRVRNELKTYLQSEGYTL